MTATRREYLDFAYGLLTTAPGESELTCGPLHASRDFGGTWNVWAVDGDRTIYLDTIRPDQWRSAAELNVHLQTMDPFEIEPEQADTEGPEPPTAAFQ